jgi:peptidylprolyl isomerase
MEVNTMLLKKHLATLTTFGFFLSCSSLVADNAVNFADEANKAPVAHEQTSKNENIDMNKLSEAFGNFIGRNLKSPGLKFDLDSIVKGIRAGANGEPSPLSDKEYEEMMATVQERAFKEMSATNLKNANDYLEKNKTAQGVVEIVPQKLQYTTLHEGNGPTVEAHSSPKIHYTGKYQDGTVFGSSEETNGPITIPLDQTIPGFSKGILGMKEGEKRRLFVHPDLGYGTTGQLPPNELLIFDIEVVKANDETKGKKAPHALDADESSDYDDEDDFSDEDDSSAFDDEDDKVKAPASAAAPATAKPTEAVKPAAK